MSRSRRKVSFGTWCAVNHSAEAKHYRSKRRAYRRTSKQYIYNNWIYDDMVVPSRKPYYSKYLAPSDGCFFDYYPPNPINPYEMWVLKFQNYTDEEITIMGLEKDNDAMQEYYKNLRK